MMIIVNSIINIIYSLIFLIPFFIIYNIFYLKSYKKVIFYLIFCIYIVSLYYIVGLPNILYIRYDMSLNLIPFMGLTNDFINLILNIILFIPLGILIPLIKKINFEEIIIHGFLVSLFIELLQIFTYRTTDIDDLITNTLGTIIGYLIIKKFKSNYENNDIYILYLVVFIIMFCFLPFLLGI